MTLSFSLCIHIFIFQSLSPYLLLYLSIYLFIYLSICPSPPIYHYIYLIFSLFLSITTTFTQKHFYSLFLTHPLWLCLSPSNSLFHTSSQLLRFATHHVLEADTSKHHPDRPLIDDAAPGIFPFKRGPYATMYTSKA